MARQLGRARPERGRDSGEVEQLRAVEQLVPVEIALPGASEAASFAIIDDRRRPEPRPNRLEVKAHAAGAALDPIDRNSISAQMPDRRVAERIVRDAADHCGFMTEAGESDRDVCFRTTDMHIETSALKQQLAPRRTQPQQQLSKADDPGHQAASGCVSSSR